MQLGMGVTVINVGVLWVEKVLGCGRRGGQECVECVW